MDAITLPVAAVNMNGYTITGLPYPSASTDAVSNISAQATYVPLINSLDQLTAPAASLSMNSHKIISMLDPTLAQDAATKSYVDTAVAGTLTQVDTDLLYYPLTTTINNIVAPDGDLSMNSYKITSVANAVSNTDAVNK